MGFRQRALLVILNLDDKIGCITSKKIFIIFSLKARPVKLTTLVRVRLFITAYNKIFITKDKYKLEETIQKMVSKIFMIKR